MPKRSSSHVIRDRAYSRFAKLIHDRGWVIRNKQDQDDYGVDCEVEIVTEDGQVTGTIFFCQLKGTEKLEWSGDTETVQVTAEQWHYWFGMSIPVVTILIDVSCDEVFWTTPFRFPPKRDAASVSIKFNRQNLLEPDCASLRFYVSSWKKGFSNETVIEQAPQFHRVFVDLFEFSNWHPDPFYYMLEQDQNLRFAFFYEHVVQLGLALGLHPKILPLHLWYRRSDAVSGDDVTGSIVFEVFKEALLYIRKFYEEVITEVKKRYVEKDVHNNLRYYFEELADITKPSKQNVFVSSAAREQEVKDPEFHLVMEKIMDRVGPNIKQFVYQHRDPKQ